MADLTQARDITRTWIRPRRQPLHGGRSGDVLTDYQLVCGVGDFELDILVRELDEPMRLQIEGQVTRAGCVHEPVRDLVLELIEAESASVAMGTSTNEFGEFGFGSRRPAPYGLRVGDALDAECVLIWEGVE